MIYGQLLALHLYVLAAIYGYRMQTSRARLMAAPDLLISGLNAVVTSDYGHPGAKFKS